MGYKVAIVGATGNVGQEMLSILAEREFPANEVVALASRRSQGKELSYGDATDAWRQSGWELVAAALDPADPTRFRVLPGNSHLTNTASETPTDYVSKSSFADATFHVEFTLPEDGESGVWIQGSYGIRLADVVSDGTIDASHCGALLPSPGLAARHLFRAR